MVGDSGAFLAQALGKALLGESVFVDQLLEAESHLDRVEVLALYVLDEGPSRSFPESEALRTYAGTVRSPAREAAASAVRRLLSDSSRCPRA